MTDTLCYQNMFSHTTMSHFHLTVPLRPAGRNLAFVMMNKEFGEVRATTRLCLIQLADTKLL